MKKKKFDYPHLSIYQFNIDIFRHTYTIINILSYSGNIWKIPAITKNDRGSYTCIAENGFGKPSRRGISIHVEFAPIITVPRRNVGQSLRNDIDITCYVEAYPSPAIIWTNNQVQLSNNQHYRYTCNLPN